MNKIKRAAEVKKPAHMGTLQEIAWAAGVDQDRYAAEEGRHADHERIMDAGLAVILDEVREIRRMVGVMKDRQEVQTDGEC